ncbi:MAG: SixA phosphatase family protein [Actinomycetes bacterium]
MKRVYLIRHGEAQFTGSGRGDHGRGLTDEGRQQARNLGGLLAGAGIEVVLASSAERAAQTATELGLDAEVRLLDDLYQAGTIGLLRALASLDESVMVAAVVGHAPGVPALVDELTGPDPAAEASALVRHHFPTATAAGIEFAGTWGDLADPRLFWAARG